MNHPLSLARPEDQERFRVTTFTEGLSFLTSMVELVDGSLLIATNTGPAASSSLFTSSQGTLLRLVDSDGDGDADGTPSVLATQPSIAGTYLLINNGKAGRNNSADLMINISGYTGELPGLGAIAVNSVFA